MIDQREVGAEMRDLRKKAGLSLRSMARKLDVSASYLCELEQGKRAWLTSFIAKFKSSLK